jgi:hypothetical protein
MAVSAATGKRSGAAPSLGRQGLAGRCAQVHTCRRTPRGRREAGRGMRSSTLAHGGRENVKCRTANFCVLEVSLKYGGDPKCSWINTLSSIHLRTKNRWILEKNLVILSGKIPVSKKNCLLIQPGKIIAPLPH